MYQVVVCPDEWCRGVNIIKMNKNETALCSSCDTQHPVDKYKVAYESETREEAVKARTKLLTKLSDNGMSFEEIKEQGYLEEPDKVFNKRHKKDTRTPKQIVLSIIKEIDNPTEEEVISRSVTYQKLDEDKAKKVIDKMVYNAELIRESGEIRLI